jgi:hypothetical protein
VCWLAAGLMIPVTYLAGITAVGLALARRVPAGVRSRVPLVLGVMHMCWGAGFLTSPKRLHHPRGARDVRVGNPAAPGGREAVAGRE